MVLPTTMLLVRHGHTAANGTGLDVPMSGWFDLPLSERGLLQADTLSRWLARSGRISALYTSPLQRAQRTAAVIGAGCGLPVRVAPGLCEIFCGEVDGLPVREVQRRYSGAWARNLEQSDPDFGWPGGETYRAFRARVLATTSELAAAHPGGRIALVTHAGVINQLLGSAAGISPARWEPFRPRNGSITEIAWQDGGVRVVRFDFRPTCDPPARPAI